MLRKNRNPKKMRAAGRNGRDRMKRRTLVRTRQSVMNTAQKTEDFGVLSKNAGKMTGSNRFLEGTGQAAHESGQGGNRRARNTEILESLAKTRGKRPVPAGSLKGQ